MARVRYQELPGARRDRPILMDTVDEMIWHINGSPRGDTIRYSEFFNQAHQSISCDRKFESCLEFAAFFFFLFVIFFMTFFE